MKTKLKSFAVHPALLAAAATVLLVSSLAHAAPPDRYREPGRDQRGPGHAPLVRPGGIVRELPYGYRPVEIRGEHYFERGGVYFRSAPGGYVVVDSPVVGGVIVAPAIGSVAVSLPLGAVNVTIGGALYYRAGDIYYRRNTQGYVVVERPAGVVVVPASPPPVIATPAYPVTVATEPTSVWVGDQEYLSKDGFFYRRTPGGMSVIEAPIGAVLPQPPTGSFALWIDGTEYCYFNSVFYRKTPAGYAVVTPPPNAYVKALPKTARTVWTGGRKYFSLNGGFYEARDQGYLVAPAPLVLTPNLLSVGTVFAAPPDGSVEVWVNDVEYLYFAGTFYRKQPTGYVVVENPL